MTTILLYALLLTPLEAGVAAATAFDVITTEINLARGRSEANPFMRNRAVRIAANSGQVALVIFASRKLRASHPRMAQAILWIPIVAHASAGAWNVHILISF